MGSPKQVRDFLKSLGLDMMALDFDIIFVYTYLKSTDQGGDLISETAKKCGHTPGTIRSKLSKALKPIGGFKAFNKAIDERMINTWQAKD